MLLLLFFLKGVVSSMKESFGFIERADKVSEVRLVVLTFCYLKCSQTFHVMLTEKFLNNIRVYIYFIEYSICRMKYSVLL